MTVQPAPPAVRIAYIISAYKLPDQVSRLVRRLYTDSSSFFVHIDKKADASVLREIRANIGDLSNTHFLAQHTCYWGGFGHVAATLEGIRTVLRLDIPFDYLVLLTGQDYPIKSTGYISRFLGTHLGSSFLEYCRLPHRDWDDGGMDRVRFWHLRMFGRHFRFPPARIRFPRRSSPSNVAVFGGSSYWCITRECAEYIARFLSDHQDFVRFFKYTDVPDELFFQTLIMNSPLHNRVVNDDLRHVHWSNWNDGRPAILTEVDLPTLASSSKLFARKFDSTVDRRILDLIDQQLLTTP